MKIVYFITKSHWGGAAKYVTDLALGLNQNAFEICVAAGGVNQLKEKSEAFGIKYREISHFGRRVALIADLFSFFEVLYILYSERPSIIHVNSSKAGGVCGLAGFLYRLSGKKLKMIFTAHGWAFHESRPKFHLSLIRIASKISCLFYDKIICITTFDYNSALRYKIAPQRKLVLIHNGINPEEIKFLKRGAAQEKLFGKEVKLAIGTIGEWNRNKGWDIFIEAVVPLFSRHPDFVVIMIGSGGNTEKQMLFSKIKEVGAQTRIKTMEFIPEAAQYLKAFDIFVFPSRKEGFPYALLEASLAKLPIVATTVGGNLDIINSDKTGILIPPENPEALGAILENFIQNPREAKKLGKNARERVQNNFSLEKMREKTYSLYSS
ncbi:hypothetical protein A3H65_03950 [Candidatus Giovannonibacteria bacterium RIFCSPLOWO2_02_FULL_45_14]|uniref:Second mannosyl transferase n=1 Tax=Candidatus Giovannonibacteria bacterium RIFCSPLOWO2_12_FULL_44_15 TaxID=1798364 RepID=A0A1F5Y107_9BACT|nr:MAG: hypothetical protein A3C75_00335 [Candidatus Giovannonibacteria bacterium RIFCSPHIGHO2_02_FULL_44_31]OGF76751.1 MAG: hypothetical protein A3E62_02770 [Candidatus Giovannonibacteria bacterium RIFCSPHIGHO2_12_FULL_44_29]OGF91216.1 MAG: hypothetical protein A3H65_03950 [Candidatus Giovannonibacteria bacterium RIFCSPLOWO2_02_FULL_45_14]OGF93762.1 MAG: hypothetical protein A3G54_02440 [Candidatus Giovannonibacteria bacterium RIFCSPLOWO2_12_FULL_44_15]